MADSYTHLHVHSHYSFLDGASSPAALARRAAELGQGTLALTDWQGLYGAVAFDAACRAVNVRPLFGAEIALTGAGGAPGPHLTLLVRNKDGWRALCRLLSAAQLAGTKGQAPVRRDVLAAHTAGLVCLSGCRHGALAAPLLRGDEEGAWSAALWLRDLFGDDLWVEVPRHDRIDDGPLGRRLAALAARLGVGTVATANVHYATPEDGPLADTLACIRAGTTLEAARHLRPNHRYHLASTEEMAVRYADLPAAVANTATVADRCAFALAHDRHTFPAVPLPAERTPNEHLRARCRAGLTERYATGDAAIWRRAVAQLDHELGVIGRLGLAGYFLVVWDVVRFAREAGVPCQGRGSAAGSVVAYTLGISRVDPLAHRLLFERFLSEERASLPDIDIDFGHRGRERVIRYLYDTYGEAHVGMACTIQTYHTKGAVRDVGKALGIPSAMLEAVATRVRRGLDADLAGAVVAVAREAALDAPIWAHFVALVARLVGTPRHLGIHNGGVVVTDPPLGDLVPLERAAMPGRVVVQWDKDSLEAAGLIKLDVLSLQSLDLVDEAVRLVRAHEGIDLDLARLPLDDPPTYALLRAGDTIGCFQVESRAQQQTLPQHAPRTFADLVAQISIIRPGPLQGGMVHPYLRRRRGEERVTYAHPLLEEPLRDTLGVILYQEQVLEVAMALAGFTPGEGDALRRAMGSKRSSAHMRALADRFNAGSAGRGVPADVAAAVFGQIAAFAGYGFPLISSGQGVSREEAAEPRRGDRHDEAAVPSDTPAPPDWAVAILRPLDPLAAWCVRFVRGAMARGVDAPTAGAVWRQLAAFAGYGFPRAHGLAFARLAYETAYLKAHHPVAFYCARLNAQPGGFYPPHVILGDARRHDVPILGPDLVASAYDCTIEAGGVRLGLRYVRGLAAATGAALVAERARGGPFADLAALCRRGRACLTPDTVAALIAGGACDGWGVPRRRLLWALPVTWRTATGLPLPPAATALPAQTLPERVAGEAWAMGLPLTAHPLATQRVALAAQGVAPLAALAAFPTGRAVTVAGQLTILQRPPTAHGVAFATLEDETGLGNLVLSPAIARCYRAALHATTIILVTGRVQRRGGAVALRVARIAGWSSGASGAAGRR